MGSQLGTEKIEAFAEALKKLAVVSKKVSEDKKINLDDLPVVIGIVPELPGIIEAFKAVGDVVAEGKDLDVAEVVKLIQVIHAKVQEVEKA